MGLKQRLFDLLPRGIKNKAQTPEAKWGLPDNINLWRHRIRDKDNNPLPMDSFFLGYDDQKNKIFWNDDRHIFTCAGNRSGKGVSLIVPNLYIYEHSVFVLDPKGENARKTAEHRYNKLNQNLIILDPFNTTNIETPINSFNPLDSLDPSSSDVIADVAMLAEALITHRGKDPYWSEQARNLLEGIIFLVITPLLLDEGERPSLGIVRDFQKLQHKKIKRLNDKDLNP